MKVESKIAWRYLWGKKSHNAINIVSGVSAAAVMVVTAAMVCVMSVMNGFGMVIEQMFSQFDPDLSITPASGTYFSIQTAAFDSVRHLDEVAIFSETVEETALVEFDGKQQPAQVKGVDAYFSQLTHIDSIIVDGKYTVYDGCFYSTVMGIGLSNQLCAGAHFIQPVHLYAPKRLGQVNRLNPSESFNHNTCYMAGIFAVNQVQYDDHVMLVALPLARQLFDLDEHTVTRVELKVNGSVKNVKKDIQRILGPDYHVLDRYEQQADFFRILRIEKWLTALLMVFILLIASFNIIGSLTMLILDKRQDIQILRHLGANDQQIRRVFLYEGWLISSLGSMLGLVIGVVLCLMQEHLGLIKLGNGSQFVLSAYPVHVALGDLILVAAVVLALGFVSAWYPSRQVVGRRE